MFAKMFCVALLIQMLISFDEQVRYFKTRPARLYGKPLRLFGLFQLPILSVGQFTFIGSVFILSLFGVVIGLFPRFFVFLALLCSFLFFNAIISLAYIQRKTNLIPLVLFVLLISPALDQPLEAPGTAWEIVLIKIAVAQIYLSAGVQKIRNSAMSWCSGESLQAYLIEHYLWNDRKSALLLARNKRLCSTVSILTLFFELTFWIIIFVPQLTFVYVSTAAFFHLGALITMRINYLKYLSPVYTVFFTDIAFCIKLNIG